MKKTLLWAALCLIGVQSSSIAQEGEQSSSDNNKDSFNLYVGFGVTTSGNYKLNDKLKTAGVPEIGTVAPEFTVGFNYMDPESKFYNDIEISTSYLNDKNTANRVRTIVTNVKLRVHYKLLENDKLFVSAGPDISYGQTYVDIYSRSNTIDLNNLDPATHTGHIALRSDLLYAGPSVAALFFKNKDFPVRLNVGYDIGVTNGKWDSDFADVNNTIKESGLGRFYARVNIGF